MNRKLLNESKVHTIATGAIASETLETVAFIWSRNIIACGIHVTRRVIITVNDIYHKEMKIKYLKKN
jgi:hypothetical protein